MDPKVYNSVEEMNLAKAAAQKAAADEQELFETTDDPEVAKAIFQKRRDTPNRTLVERACDEDDFKKAMMRAAQR